MIDTLPPIIITNIAVTTDQTYNPSEQPVNINVKCMKPSIFGSQIQDLVEGASSIIDNPLNHTQFIKPFVRVRWSAVADALTHVKTFYGSNKSLLECITAPDYSFQKDIHMPNIKAINVVMISTGYLIDTKGTDLEEILPNEERVFPEFVLLNGPAFSAQTQLNYSLRSYVYSNADEFGIAVVGLGVQTGDTLPSDAHDMHIYYPPVAGNPPSGTAPWVQNDTGFKLGDLTVSLPLFDMEIISLSEVKRMADENIFNVRLQTELNADGVIDGVPISIVSRPWIVRSGDSFRVVMFFDKLNFISSGSGIGNRFYSNYLSFAQQDRDLIFNQTAIQNMKVEIKKQAIDPQDNDRSFTIYDDIPMFQKPLQRKTWGTAASIPTYLSVLSTPPIKYSDYSADGNYAVTVTLNVKDGLQTRLNNIGKTFPKAPTSHVIETVDGPVLVPGLPEVNKNDFKFLLKLLLQNKGALTINETVGVEAFVDVLTGSPEVLRQYGYGENELMGFLKSINEFVGTNANKPTASSVGSALIGNFRPYTKNFSNVEIVKADNSFAFLAAPTTGFGPRLPTSAIGFATLGEFLASLIFKRKGTPSTLFTSAADIVLPFFERSKYRPGELLNLLYGFQYGKNLGNFFEMLLNSYEQTSKLPPISTGDVDTLELEKIYMRKAKKIVETLPFQTDIVENKNFVLKPENNELAGKSLEEINALDAILEEELSPIQGFLNAYLIQDFLDVLTYFRIAVMSGAALENVEGMPQIADHLQGSTEGQYDVAGLPQTSFEGGPGPLRDIIDDPRMMGCIFNRQINAFTLQVLSGFESSIDSPIWKDVSEPTVTGIQHLIVAPDGAFPTSYVFRIVRTVDSSKFQTPQIRSIFDKFDVEDKYIVI